MEKIITSRGVLDVVIPINANTDAKGELYLVCPICTPSRQKEHQNEKKFAINMHKLPHPWRCNHCNEGGYVIDEAYMEKAKIKPILDNKTFLPLSDPLVDWFWKERKISKQTLNELQISASEEMIRQTKKIVGEEEYYDQVVSRKCINFKYFKDGILINIKYRDKNKNFKLIQDATKILYNIDSLKNQKEAIIVEGEMDVLAYHEAGIKNVVSVPNGTTISPSEIEEYQKTGKFRNNLNMEYLDLCLPDLEGIETFYLATDDDTPGQKLREELSRRLGKNKCRYIKFSEYKRDGGLPCKDGNDVLIHFGKDALRNTLQNSYAYPIDGVTTASVYWEKMEAIFDHGRQKGFSTGYKSLDPHFTWMPGWLTLANGYPGEGKSSVLFNLVLITTVLYKWKWGLYCPENYPPENVLDTLAEILVGDTADISFGDRMSKERYAHAVRNHLEKYIFIVDNEEGYTPAQLRDVKKSLIRQHGINGFLTDPWKNLYHDLGNMTIDMYLQRELAAEVRLSVKNDLINIICHHPPTPPRDKDKTYPAPSYFELIGGQIWAASSYAMICIHKHDRVSWMNTMTEFHVQKIKEHKLAGIPTDRANPVLLKFDRRSGRFLERKDILSLESPYTIFPFSDYLQQTQSTFDGF
jgi:twinkle protein